MIYDKQYFINKFEAIPEKQWCISWWFSFAEDGSKQHCALGHCGQKTSHNNDNPAPKEAQALVNLFGNDRGFVPTVNDGQHNKYPQATPKARMLAALRDLP